MCGIAGYIEPIHRHGRPQILEGMLRRLVQRGPDGHGKYTAQSMDWRIHLGHRRLAIIDLSTGQQPMGNEQDSLQITFNGEIFNFKKLRNILEMAGYHFQTRSDTEVILNWFQYAGLAGLRELNGIFAFAIWDKFNSRMLLARDRAGVKPLYYSPLPKGGLAFASELTALLEHPEIEHRLNTESLGYYFFHDYVPAPMSAIRNVCKLSPGHYVIWENGVLSEEIPFWRLDLHAMEVSHLSVEKLEEDLSERLSVAVSRQMVSDVPIGIFLSGGIDSSIVAALAQKNCREPVQTFSIVFEDPGFDESRYARMVAKHIRSQHREKKFGEANLLLHVQAALNALDEPLADPSLIPTYFLSAFAAQYVKVALGGDGGDELWAGYPTYKAVRWGEIYKRFPTRFREMLDFWSRRVRAQDGYQSLEWKAKRFVQRWDQNPALCHYRWMSSTDLPDLEQVLGLHSLPHLLLPNLDIAGDRINALLALDFGGYLPGSVLAKVDRASMAHGLEVRPPLLDNDFIDWSFSLPSHLKLHKGLSKFLLKRAGQRLLPKTILNRKKRGFAIPLSRWVRGPLAPCVETSISDSPLWERSHGASSPLSRATFRVWQKQHEERRCDRSKSLWALVVLDQWMKKENILP